MNLFFTENILIHNIMTNEHKQTILSLAQSLIRQETENLLSRLNELTIYTDNESKSKIISDCDEIINKINKRLKQLKE
jgi:hypothetical protein